MWKFILPGAVLATGILVISLNSSTVGPALGVEGEGVIRVLGVTVDRVPIPPETPIPVERLKNGYLAVLAGVAVVGILVGGGAGWVVWWVRSRLIPRPA